MEPKIKNFYVPVFVSWFTPSERPYNPETDSTQQSMRIMDVPGYSHFVGQPKWGGIANVSGTLRTAVIRGTNREQVRKFVQKALGDKYFPGVNVVNYEE